MKMGLSKFLAVALITVAVVGCGDGRPKRVLVSGVVTIDDKPLERGTIKFSPVGARSSRATIGEDGSFVMNCYEGGDGIIPGTHRVAVISNEQVGASKMKWYIPTKYASYKTSGLEYTIEEDTPELKIELTWDGGKPFTTK